MLKKGDNVVMHTCIEADNPKYFGKIWTCSCDEYCTWEGIYKQNLVFLEGFSGSFLAKYLQKVNTNRLEQDIHFLANLPVKMQNVNEEQWLKYCEIVERCVAKWI